MNIISRIVDRLLAWHLKPSNTQTFDVLDGLRGLAILLVIGDHLIYINPKSNNTLVQFMGGVFGTGGCGVTLFFCLSGYLVSLPFWKLKRMGKAQVVPTGYVQRRWFKIYPPLALSILLLTPIYILIQPSDIYLIAAAKWLVGAPILFPVDRALNPVMWSLIVEVQFYIVLPIFMLLLRDVSMRNSIWLLPLLLAVIGICSRLAFFAFGSYGPIHSDIYIPPLSYLDMFAMGVLVAGLHAMDIMKRSWVKIGNIGFVIFFMMIPIISILNLENIKGQMINETVDFVFKIVFGCMLCYVMDAECLASRALCSPLLRWFGIISYEWYLFHQPISWWLRHAFGPANGSILWYCFITGVSFALSLLIAALVYKYYSLPILMYGRVRR